MIFFISFFLIIRFAISLAFFCFSFFYFIHVYSFCWRVYVLSKFQRDFVFFFYILLNTGGDETGSKNVKNRVCRLIHSASSSCHDILFRVCHLNLRKNRLVVPRGLRVSWCATICFNERLTKCYPEAGALYRVKIAATMWSKSATRNELSHPRACLYPFLTSFKYFLRF